MLFSIGYYEVELMGEYPKSSIFSEIHLPKRYQDCPGEGIHSTVGSDCRFHESGSTKRIEKLEEESKGSEQDQLGRARKT